MTEAMSLRTSHPEPSDITDIRNEERRKGRLAALSASDNPLDRLAAKRARELGRELERPTHPSAWPEGAHEDADELFATHGSGR